MGLRPCNHLDWTRARLRVRLRLSSIHPNPTHNDTTEMLFEFPLNNNTPIAK